MGLSTLFLSSIAIILLCLSLFLGSSGGRSEKLSTFGVLTAIALAPTFIALASYGGMAFFSYAAPSKLVIGAFPVALALLCAAPTVSRYATTPFASGRRTWTTVACLALAASFVPLLHSMIAHVRLEKIPHDMSIYLLEAAGLSRAVTEGPSGWLDWLFYRHPSVSHPHGMTYTAYLAWGFVFEEQPGFMSDKSPQLLIVLNHVSVFAAAAAVMMSRRSPVWGVVGAAAITADSVWSYEIAAFSRDSFYIAPALVLFALLLRSGTWSRFGFASNVRLLLALVGGLAGHSLGILFVASLSLGAGVVAVLRLGRRVVRLKPFWLAGLAQVATAAWLGARYYGQGASELGFGYPFYVDPFHIELFRNNFRFLAEPGLSDVLGYVLPENGLHRAWFLPVAGAAVVTGITSLRIGRMPAHARLWLALLVCCASMLAIAVAVPLRLDGTSIAGAWATNRRYGFAFGLTTWLLIAESLRLLVIHATGILGRRVRRYAYFYISWVVAASAAAWAYFNGGLYYPYWRIIDATPAMAERKICDDLNAKGVRMIFFDNDATLYRCPENGIYAFSPDGARITGAADDRSIAAALDEQQVDGVYLFFDEKTWWSGTRLFAYLSKNWVRVEHPESAIFIRPSLASGTN